ncbi:MAG TPA: DUF1206 domain-containing protein [Gaiellaceae bacterium]|nr:DUF1206 domain-containing protein [Gaiellaceae bacterium]
MVHSTAFDWFSRAGFVARGLVYALVGALAVCLAVGLGGKATNQQGALETVDRQPFGHVLLIAIAAGLAGYALWRLVRAILGRGPEAGRDSVIDRVAGAGSGIFYALLAYGTVQIIGGSRPSSSVPKKTAGVFAWPGGRWAILIAGLVMIGVGLYQGYRAVTAEFLEDAKTGEMSEGTQHAFTTVARIGHLARMVVFSLVGLFLVVAAVQYDPKKAEGLGGVLGRLLREPGGNALMGVVAAGLVAFGLYSMADARYHRL